MNNNDERDSAEEAANRQLVGSQRRTSVRLGDRLNFEFERSTERQPPTLPRQDTWIAFREVDALLGQLRGDTPAVLDVLHRMSLPEVSRFGQHLHQLGQLLVEVATAKARETGA